MVLAEQQQQIVHEFPRNRREIVRASISKLNGALRLDLRQCFEAETDDTELVYRPTAKGINIAAESLPELKKAIEAFEHALAN